MHALLMANGPFSAAAEAHLRGLLPDTQLHIGVDGGARTLFSLGIVPHVVTGDGDSLTEPERQRLLTAGSVLVPTPDQDYTDLDKALRYVFDERGAARATVFGATGGRLDHSYSVFSALIKYGRHFPIALVDEQARYFLATGQTVLEEERLAGRTLSLLAFGRVEGVTTTGVEWPLTDEWLAPGLRDGTLNRVTANRVEISVSHGDLIVMLHHGQDSL